jgi:hypothetical protein
MQDMFILNNIALKQLPFPAIPALSSIEASLLSSVVPTGQAERSSFFAAVSSAIPTGTSAKSEFIASITSKVGGATDAAQFSSAVSGVLQDITSASSENVPTSTGSAQNTGASTTEGGNADSSAPGMDRGLVVAVTAVIVTVFMCSLGHVF